MQKPPFLKDSGGSAQASGGEKFPNRPQESGGSNVPDGSSDKFPNRPQPQGGSHGNPQSVPSGGKLPFKGPAKDPGKPFKLGS